MHIVFTPDDGEKREWDFKLGRLMTTEVETLEKIAHLKFQQLVIGVASKDATSRRALIWVLLKREDPALQFMDVDFPMDAFASELDEEEQSELRAMFARIGLKPDERRAALAEVGIPDEPGAGPKEEPATVT